MTTLKRGITGFITDLSDKKDAVSFSEFERDMFTLARRLKGKVVACIAFDSTENYFQCLLEVNNKQYCLLCNTVFPYLGVCVSGQEDNQRTFIMPDAIASNLAELREYHLLGPDVLHQKITNTELTMLSFEELKELQRWHPAELHQVIFNEWD